MKAIVIGAVVISGILVAAGVSDRNARAVISGPDRDSVQTPSRQLEFDATVIVAAPESRDVEFEPVVIVAAR